MWHGVFGLVSPSISGERSFICSKSIKNGSSGLYFWTPRSLKTKALSRFRTSATTNLVTQHHLSPGDTASHFTGWRSITFHPVTLLHISPGDVASHCRRPQNLNYCTLQLYSTKPVVTLQAHTAWNPMYTATISHANLQLFILQCHKNAQYTFHVMF